MWRKLYWLLWTAAGTNSNCSSIIIIKYVRSWLWISPLTQPFSVRWWPHLLVTKKIDQGMAVHTNHSQMSDVPVYPGFPWFLSSSSQSRWGALSQLIPTTCTLAQIQLLPHPPSWSHPHPSPTKSNLCHPYHPGCVVWHWSPISPPWASVKGCHHAYLIDNLKDQLFTSQILSILFSIIIFFYFSFLMNTSFFLMWGLKLLIWGFSSSTIICI